MKRVFMQLRLHFKGNFLPVMMNVGGMTIAFIAAIVILTQVYYDATYDRFHENADRIYKLQMKYPTETPDSVGRTFTLSQPFAYELLQLENTPQITSVSFSSLQPRQKTWHGADGDFAKPYFLVDSSFVRMFSFNIAKGTLDDFYKGKDVVLVPESEAEKQWKTTDIVGKQVTDNPGQITVGAVYNDFPSNSILKNNMYRPINKYKLDEDRENWQSWLYYVFVELDSSDSYQDVQNELEERLVQIKEKYASVSPLAMAKWEVELVPLHELHYIYEVEDDNHTSVSKREVTVLFGISMVIILLAGFNFTNFFIALIPRRIKNANLRRIMGAGRGRLIASILAESVSFVLVSWVLAVVVVCAFAGEWLFGTAIDRMTFGEVFPVICGTLPVAILLGVLMGIYPAVSLTRETPHISLKRHFGLSRSGRITQNILLTVQLFCAFTLMSCSYTILKQNSYLTGGGILDKDRLLFAYMKDTIPDSKPLYDKLKTVPGVEDVALSLKILTSQDDFGAWGWKHVITTVLPVSTNYLDVVGVEIKEGRTFNSSDTLAIIFNETAASEYPDEIEVGKRFAEFDEFPGFEIVGICKDFNYNSLRKEILPMGFLHRTDDHLTCVNVRLSVGCDVDKVKKSLADALDEVDVNYRHNFKSLDDVYVSTYRYETITAKRMTLFALVAIIISLMGLCGMVIMSSEYRVKEIAVKQVMGASVWQLLKEQLEHYSIMLTVAIVCSLPLFYYFAEQYWLTKFFYHVEFTWLLYIIPAMVVIVLVFAIILLFVLRYLHKNPVEILKYE